MSFDSSTTNPTVQSQDKEFTRAIVMTFVKCYIDQLEQIFTTESSSTSNASSCGVSPTSTSSSSTIPPRAAEQILEHYNNSSHTMASLSHSSAFTPVRSNSIEPTPNNPPPVVVTLEPRYVNCLHNICATLRTHHQDALTDLERFIGTSDNFDFHAAIALSDSSQLQENNLAFDYAAFCRVMNYVFERQKSWGRVIMLLAFTGMLALRTLRIAGAQQVVVSPSHREMYILHYVNWATEYVHTNLRAWIQSNDGWDGILSYEASGPLGQVIASPGQLVMFGGILVLSGLVVYFLAKGRQ